MKSLLKIARAGLILLVATLAFEIFDYGAANAVEATSIGSKSVEPVPFVGCASDGQQGPQPAPELDLKKAFAPISIAKSVAYYSSGDMGVLAPRGWRCFGLSGSNGESLFVTPATHGADLLKSDAGLKGPVVQLSVSDGETSGRFEAAAIAARLFPAKKAFVKAVIAEGLEPASDFPWGPFPTDRLVRRSATEVEFETPANSNGIGLMSRLVKDGDPIEGGAKIDEDNSVTLLVVRLPRASGQLASAIVKAAR